MKESFHLEYFFGNVSLSVLWSSISTPAGLSGWFADNVHIRGNEYTFVWGSSEQVAQLIHTRTNNYVRFHWMEDDPKYYFELKISHVELTSDIILSVTDFSEPEEKNDLIDLWNQQVVELKKALGM